MAYDNPFGDSDPNQSHELDAERLKKQLEDPAYAPPNSRWNPETQQWDTTPAAPAAPPSAPPAPSVATPAQPTGDDYKATGQTQDPGQWAQNAGRWSYKLQNKPTWLEGLGPEAEARAKAIYDDPNADDNALMQQMLSSYRGNMGGEGHVDMGDAGALRGMFGGGGGAPNSAASWASGGSGQRAGASATNPAGASATNPAGDPGIARSIELQTQLMQRMFDASQAQQAANRGRSDALYGQLQGRANQALDVNANDRIIRRQAYTFAAGQERSRRNYLSDVAERSGPYANLRGEQRMSAERTGQANAGFEAELMGRELQTRRNEISQSLGQMGGMLSGEQQMALQSELGQLDRAIGQQGLGLQRYGLDTQRQLGFGNLDLNKLQSNRQNDQFMAQLGMNAEDRAAYWDSLRRGLL